MFSGAPVQLRVEYKKESQQCVCNFFRKLIKSIEGLTTLSECTTDEHEVAVSILLMDVSLEEL